MKRLADHIPTWAKPDLKLTWPGLWAASWLCLAVGLSLPLNADPGTGQDTTTGYHYDAGGNLTKAISPLDPNPANPTVATDLGYDSLDRNTQVQQQPVPVAGGGSQRPTVDMEYDGLDQVTQVTDPRALPIRYHYLPSSGPGNLTRTESPDSGKPLNNRPNSTTRRATSSAAPTPVARTPPTPTTPWAA